MLKQKGFTMIELLMAMAVFSFVLLIVVGGFVVVSRLYTQNINARSTQQAGRFLVEELARSIRLANAAGTDTVNGKSALCLVYPGRVVEYFVDSAGVMSYQELVPASVTLSADALNTTCASGTQAIAGTTKRLIGAEVSILDFSATIIMDNTVTDADGPIVRNVQSVKLTLKVQNQGAIASTANGCTPNTDTFQTCSVTSFDTAVSLRGLRNG